MSEYNFAGPISGNGFLIGDGGKIQNNYANTDLGDLVNRLAEAVAENRDELSDPSACDRAVQEVRTAVAAKRPDVDRLRRILPVLTAGAGTVTAVTDAVASIAAIISSIG